MLTPTEYRQKRATFIKEQEAKGLVHWSGKVWLSKEEFEARYQARLEAGRLVDLEYRAKLWAMHGCIPDWAPERIRRT